MAAWSFFCQNSGGFAFGAFVCVFFFVFLFVCMAAFASNEPLSLLSVYYDYLPPPR